MPSRTSGPATREKALLHGALGFLLFAGALHIELGDLLSRYVAAAGGDG